MNLGIFINQHLLFDGRQYTCDYHTLLPFTFSLTKYFENIDILAPVQYTHDRKGRNTIDVPATVRIIPLSYYEGPLGVIRVLHKILPATMFKTLRRKHEWDMTACIMPSVAGFVFDIATISKKKFYLVRGNKIQTLKVLHSAHRTNRLFLFVGALVQKFMQWRIDKGIHAFVLGQELYDFFKKPENSVHIWKGLLPDNLISEYKKPEYKRPSDPFHILFIGRLTPEKGVFDLLQIISSLCEKGESVILNIVGEGPLEIDLRCKIKEMKLENVARLIGPLAHPDPLFKEYEWADAFLLPSYTEGIPRVIAEAMSNGVPVVASEVGGIPGIISHKDNGLLSPAGNIERFVENLLCLIRNEKDRHEIGKAGYQKAIQSFTDSAQRAEMAQILGLNTKINK